ncbi:hypothetical protein BDZ91DRAFT_712055 [Kalaharituber pfeilii]|nr:hypothetical protein BDZ91DRAFT_712055 [Kalaharituber pfeilii]
MENQNPPMTEPSSAAKSPLAHPVKAKEEEEEDVLPDIDLDELFGEIEKEYNEGNSGLEFRDDPGALGDVTTIDGPASGEFNYAPQSFNESQNASAFYPASQGERQVAQSQPVPRDLNLNNVTENVAAIKQAIISNHVLLTRFLHLQTAYRALGNSLATERNLREQREATIIQLREQLNMQSQDTSPQQDQIKKLEEDRKKERAGRIAFEESVRQLQNEVTSQRTLITKLKQEKTKGDQNWKSKIAALNADVDKYKHRIVEMMSENRALLTQLTDMTKDEMLVKNKKLTEELVQLRQKVVTLEATNIRLKASRSVLAGGGGNDAGIFPRSPPAPENRTISSAPPAVECGSFSKPHVISSDDDIVYMGSNIASAMQGLQLPNSDIKTNPIIGPSKNTDPEADDLVLVRQRTAGATPISSVQAPSAFPYVSRDAHTADINIDPDLERNLPLTSTLHAATETTKGQP